MNRRKNIIALAALAGLLGWTLCQGFFADGFLGRASASEIVVPAESSGPRPLAQLEASPTTGRDLDDLLDQPKGRPDRLSFDSSLVVAASDETIVIGNHSQSDTESLAEGDFSSWFPAAEEHEVATLDALVRQADGEGEGDSLRRDGFWNLTERARLEIERRLLPDESESRRPGSYIMTGVAWAVSDSADPQPEFVILAYLAIQSLWALAAGNRQPKRPQP